MAVSPKISILSIAKRDANEPKSRPNALPMLRIVDLLVP